MGCWVAVCLQSLNLKRKSNTAYKILEAGISSDICQAWIESRKWRRQRSFGVSLLETFERFVFLAKAGKYQRRFVRRYVGLLRSFGQQLKHFVRVASSPLLRVEVSKRSQSVLAMRKRSCHLKLRERLAGAPLLLASICRATVARRSPSPGAEGNSPVKSGQTTKVKRLREEAIPHIPDAMTGTAACKRSDKNDVCISIEALQRRDRPSFESVLTVVVIFDHDSAVTRGPLQKCHTPFE